ncbi:MAG: CapA family protein [Clostridiales bacterium]|nr:CapA family protein [Clostridiales bacterium]
MTDKKEGAPKSGKNKFKNIIIQWSRLLAALLFLIMTSRFQTSGENLPGDMLSFFSKSTEESPRVAGNLNEPPSNNTLSEVKIAVVGDLMVHQWQLDDAYNKSTGEYNFDHNFETIKKYLKDPDLTVGNLETTFAGSDVGYSDYPRFNTPDSFAVALRDAGFDMVSTANNHTNDKNEAGIFRTLDVLDSLGIQHFGSYRSQDESKDIMLKDVNGIKFAFLSYTYGTNGLPLVSGHEWSVNQLSKDKIVSDIRRAKALEPDFIVIMPHMGVEYAEVPSDTYKQWVKFMFESGADIVLASHPHVIQPMEYTTITDENGESRVCFVIYSLGNFISSQRTIPRDEGIILNLYFEKNNSKARLVNVSFIPTWVQFVNANGLYDIKTLSVYDALSKTDGGKPGLRSKDISRLWNAHSHITRQLLGNPISNGEIRNEYFLPNSEFTS